jgi:hypothetical protein
MQTGPASTGYGEPVSGERLLVDWMRKPVMELNGWVTVVLVVDWLRMYRNLLLLEMKD